MDRLRRSLVVSLAGLGLAHAAWAADPKTITVGVENLAFQPHYGTQNGEYTGYFRDLMDAFAKKEGLKVIYKPMDIDDLYAAFFKGQVDFKYPDDAAWRADARKGLKVAYSKPSVGYVDGTLKLASNQDLVAGKIKVLGKPAGFFTPPYSSAIEAGLKVLEFNSTQELVEALRSGKVDAIYHNVDVALYYARTAKIKDVVFAPDLPMIQSDYRLSSFKRPDIIKKFDDFVAQEKDFCDKLRDHYNIDAARRLTTMKIFQHKG
ncbi:transporter substrate-binding domain-containing protein [Aquabacterium sp.]|uniref:amino acid ABC transporter substrate-binding protein n=1 Tax=Aquabacterium sp. TaxID=1872578 RepID=UPI002E2F5BD7|nr:transporter substrate-binding domain-containing protein [Aquabacterium sp.]HEX5311769.1 transporter substrate-binding domain-containing protein [Aquabacterium sp.]